MMKLRNTMTLLLTLIIYTLCINVTVFAKVLPTEIQSFNITSISKTSDYVVGNEYKITSKATSTNGAEYKFWVADFKKGDRKLLKDYSESDTVIWTPTSSGRFEIILYVRDKKSTLDYEAIYYKDIDVISNEQYKINSIANSQTNKKSNSGSQMNIESDTNEDNKDENINPKPSIKTNVKNFKIEALDGNPEYVIGNRFKVTADAESTNNPEYRFWVGNLDTGKWQVLKDYSETNSIVWVPTAKGKFEVSVHVRDKQSKEKYEAVKYEDIYVDFGAHTKSRKQSQLQLNLVNYLLASKNNRDSVMNRAIKLHDGDERNTCVYFTSEALRRSGLKSLPTYVCNTRQLSTKLSSYGWVKCTDYTKLLPGDICFSVNGGTGYPSHAYTFVSWVKEGDYEWANIIDNQRSRFNGEPLHKRTISHGTDWFDKFQYFMYKPR